MATGALPFDDPSIILLMQKHVVETPPAPRAINLSISVEMEAVIEGLL